MGDVKGCDLAGLGLKMDSLQIWDISGTFQVFVPLVLGLDPARLQGVQLLHRMRPVAAGQLLLGVVEHLDKVAGEDARLAAHHPPPPAVLNLAQELHDVLNLG